MYIEIVLFFIIWGIVCFMIGFNNGSKSMIKYVTKHLEKVITPEQFLQLIVSMDKEQKTGE